MRRFAHSVWQNFLSLVVVFALMYGVSLPTVLKWITDNLFKNESMQTWLKRMEQFRDAHPTVVILAFVVMGLVYCYYKSKPSDENPRLKVTGIPMKGLGSIVAATGQTKIVSFVYVPFENVSNGTDDSATTTDLGARVELHGTRMRWHGDYSVPIEPEAERSWNLKINLHPGDKATINIVIQHPTEPNSLLPSTEQNWKPQSFDILMALSLQDPLYIARVTFRGRGVNQRMWFSVWNWNFPNDYPVSIDGPLSLWKRTKLRLHLLGVLKKWQPYKPYKETPEDVARREAFQKSLDEITETARKAINK